MTDTDQLYFYEIQCMMHGCGDHSRPLPSTVKTVANIVQQQVLMIARRAEEVAGRRGTKSIIPKDILFLMRRSPDKLYRLYKYLSVKELRNTYAGFGMEQHDMKSDEVEGDVTSLLDPSKKSRHSLLQEMFLELDLSGELADMILNHATDSIRHRRELRADTIAQSLDPVGYMEFSKARRAAFVNSRLSQQKFLEWISLAIDQNSGLLGEPPIVMPRLNSPAIDILAYLAKETVAMIVDLAFLVRQDSSGLFPGGPLRPLTLRPPASSSTSLDGSPLTAAEVREAVRRYWLSLFTESAGFVRLGQVHRNQILGSGLEVLEKLTEWPSEEVRCHLNDILPELLSCLTNDDKGKVLPAVHALLVTCLPSVPLTDAERAVLKHAMPAARQLFMESLEGIKLRLEDVSHTDEIIDTLSSLLQVCVELLKCMDSVLAYIVSQGKVTITDVSSVPITVVSIMLETFKHCKESETMYGSIFQDVGDVLGLVFRQCHQVQVRFFEVMTQHIHFDCSMEDDVCLLAEILQVLCQIGEQVMGLDVKSMAEHWKGFARLVQQHLEPLRERLDISYPLCYLSQEVETNLSQLSKPSFLSDSKTASKHLKTTSFVLKIIVKLCEQFGSGDGFLGNCCSALLQLLLCLYRHSPSSPLLQALDSNFINEVERHLTVAADPLLIHLVNEGDFQKEYFKKSKEIHETPQDNLPFMFLTMAIMKRLVHSSSDQRNIWLGEQRESNIIGCLLECVKFGHVELCSEVSLQAAVQSGDPPRHCDLYEALVCHSAGLVVSLSKEQFTSLENIFLDAVTDSYFWPALVAADVWCVCIRAGTADLTSDLVLYLADIVSSVGADGITRRLDFMQISLLLRRMFCLLGSKGKQTLVELYPYSKHPYLWKVIGIKNLPKHLQEAAEHSLVSNSLLCVTAFFDTSNVSNFKEMFYSLFGLSAALDCVVPASSSNSNLYTAISSYLIQLWVLVAQNCVQNSSESLSSDDSWLLRILEVLCACTHHLVHSMTDTQILEMLKQLQNIVSCSSTTFKLSSLKVLRGLATKTFDGSPNQYKICSLISHMFNDLLQDSNPLLKESSLETFEYFAHFTAHESILADAVGGNVIIQEIVAQYLKKEPPLPVPGQIDFHEYLKIQGSRLFVHQCKGKPRIPSPSPEQRPIKKMRSEDSFDLSAFVEGDLLHDIVETDMSGIVTRISDDIQILISSSSFKNMPSSAQKQLKSAVTRLNEFIGIYA